MAHPVPAPLIASILRQGICRHLRFEPGDVLRHKGQHYQDMYLVTKGRVDVDRGADRGERQLVVSDAGSPIGEIGFLRGTPATATVTARTAAEVVVIDDPALAHLEREQPALAAQLLRQLAEIADERTSCNLVTTATAFAGPDTIEVLLCRTTELRDSAMRLRYEVYCQELGRQSPNADHEKQIITDELDRHGHTFIAVEAGETIGTLRANAASEGPLGVLEELYGMRRSAHHPHATAVCTKFIVRKSRRGGPAAMKLIGALTRFGLRHSVRECYIDCIPVLLPYYKALGFTITGEKFLHRENGPSHPMVIDLAKHGHALAAEFRPRDYLGVFVKAQAIKWLDRIRDRGAASREAVNGSSR